MAEIPELLVQWYEAEGRRMAWRETRDPYQIWIAETIFQQTRIEQGEPYLHRFLRRFPDVFALADAPLDDVLKHWEGLGYYSRARNLHHAARQLVTGFGGVFPKTPEELTQLKGIGPYTSRAIASFAYDSPCGVLDGNVARVISRITAEPLPVNEATGKNRLQRTADRWAATVDSRKLNFALMDLGSTRCTPTQPACGVCPVMERCEAYRQGMTHLFPKKKAKAARKVRDFDFYYIRTPDGALAIRQRPADTFWGGLWELPNEEISEGEYGAAQSARGRVKGRIKHVFTHFDMMIRIIETADNHADTLTPPIRLIQLHEIPIFAFSKAVHKIFAQVLPDGKVRT